MVREAFLHICPDSPIWQLMVDSFCASYEPSGLKSHIGLAFHIQLTASNLDSVFQCQISSSTSLDLHLPSLLQRVYRYRSGDFTSKRNSLPI
jgi:hypothetical protein